MEEFKKMKHRVGINLVFLAVMSIACLIIDHPDAAHGYMAAAFVIIALREDKP